ncbi:hypothetical protein QWZ10_12065 [Paracoccus cavernae]|uniref:Flagellin n=1 Tax=Paracoccus cavernae TaxID=1571207 RepID=A0ABT8D8Y6_9RHOB|nr:hypothetical protein [Paracoccus cavernae]
MTSSAPQRGTTANPYSAEAHKNHLTISQAERQHRIMPNQMCTNSRMQLDNINRLIAAAENEYRRTLSDLNTENWKGRGWLVVDFIHKTSMASLDMAASLLQIAAGPAGDRARVVADIGQTGSDVAGALSSKYLFGQELSTKDTARTMMGRALTHVSPRGAGGAFAKGTADIGLTGWSNIDNITGAQSTDARNARLAEASVDSVAQVIQRAADTLDKGTAGGNVTAQRVGAVAQLSRSIASYNREVEGVFDRRLETYTSNQNSRALVKAAFDRNMTNFRRQAAEITRLLASCQ